MREGPGIKVRPIACEGVLSTCQRVRRCSVRRRPHSVLLISKFVKDMEIRGELIIEASQILGVPERCIVAPDSA